MTQVISSVLYRIANRKRYMVAHHDSLKLCRESGAAISAALPVSPVDDEQGPLVGGPEVGDIYSVGT